MKLLPRILALALALAGPAEAHHSFAMFDPAKVVTVKGTVKEFQWSNPHVVLWLYADAAEGAQPELWSVELTSPGNLTRMGWSKHSLNPGDKIEVSFNPLRDGAHGGGFIKATVLATGQVLAGSLRDLETPGVK